jgi:putative ABC transport system permease protein
MTFALRMAWRETRASAFRLLFFFLCVALGVAAIVVLRSVMQHVTRTLTGEARTFIGADVLISSPRDWAPETRAGLERLLAKPGITGAADVIETQTMAAGAPGDGTGLVRLVELYGLGRGFPFYGTLELADGQPYAHELIAGHGVLVQPELLIELGLEVGDRLRLAGEMFTIRGVVERDRLQRGGGFSFGPRAYIDVEDLRATSLLGVGSRATYRIAVRVADGDVERIDRELDRAIPRQVGTVRNWRNLEDRLGRNLTIAENYLSLVGFAIVVLGGIGVWSVTRVVIQEKIRSVAILKCVGATSGQVLATYVLQVMGLAAGGCVLGVAIGAVGVAAIPVSLLEPLGVTALSLTASAAVQGVAVGLLVSLLFALVPLLEVRRVKPLLLLRADTMHTARRRDAASFAAWAASLLALTLVAVWQADSLEAGVYVSAGLGGVILLLLAAGHVLVRLTAPLARSKRFALRHAVVSLARPGNQTRVILLAVGLGCFFILAVRSVQSNLLAEFAAQLGGQQADLIMIDVQQDQTDGVRALVAPYAEAPPQLLPLLRARVVGVFGRRVRLEDPAEVRDHGELTRVYGLTYRSTLDDNERITAGRFWDGPLRPGELPDGIDTEVSIEARIHEEALVDVGDAMRFDVAGVRVTARVTNIREVAWDEARNGGFVFVLRPWPAADRVPQSFVGFLNVADATARGTLQRDLVMAYPNVSVIDLREVLASIREVIDDVTLGISVVGAVTLIAGVLILVGAVAMTKFQRLYEAAIYRTLGAGTRLLAAMVAIEYGMLGLLAGLMGAAGALALSYLLARNLFDIDWHPAPDLLALGVALTAIVVSVVGLIASIDVLVRKPLGTLRSQ